MQLCDVHHILPLKTPQLATFSMAANAGGAQNANAILLLIALRFFIAGCSNAQTIRDDGLMRFQLPAIPLSSRDLQGSKRVLIDRRILLGGFSDLWRAPTDPKGEFWIVTDRGPNATAEVDGKKRRT